MQGNVLEGLQGQRSQRQKTELYWQAKELEGGGLGHDPSSVPPMTSDKSLTSLSLKPSVYRMGKRINYNLCYKVVKIS